MEAAGSAGTTGAAAAALSPSESSAACAAPTRWWTRPRRCRRICDSERTVWAECACEGLPLNAELGEGVTERAGVMQCSVVTM